VRKDDVVAEITAMGGFSSKSHLECTYSRTAQSNINDQPGLKDKPPVGPSVNRESFGTTPDGAQVDKYTLSNARGVTVTVLTYGGIVQSIEVPDKNGKLGDITLGFDRLDDYIKGGYYFGAIIGRYANRIAKGQFKGTVLNLTNHTFFNLAGAGNGNVLDQIAMINADQFAPVDNTMIPTGELRSVVGTALDFTQPTAIGARIYVAEAQAANAGAKLVHQVRDWFSGVAIKMGRRQGATKEHI